MFPLDFLLVALGVFCFLWLRRGKKLPGNEARCAKCMYIANGLPTPICPECGSDLATPGAVVVGGKLPASRLARSIGWSLFCLLTVGLLLACAWAVLSATVLPEVSDQSSTITLYWPASKAYKNIEIEVKSHGVIFRHNSSPLPRQLSVKIIRNDNTPRTLLVDPSNLHFCDPAVAGSTFGSAPLDEIALASWLRSSGVKGDDKLIAGEMAVTMNHLELLRVPKVGAMAIVGTVFGGSGSGSTGSVRPLEWLALLPIGFLLLLWGIGMWRILIH